MIIHTYKTDRATVRRFLLETQGLPIVSKPKRTPVPTIQTVLEQIQKLECVQLDPVSVVERNHNLVLGARLPGYKPNHYNSLLSKGLLFEYWANAMCAIPINDYPIFKPIRAHRKHHVSDSLDNMKDVVKHVLNRLELEGPLPSRAFKADTKVHGYWDNQVAQTKETSYALTLLLDVGDIRVVSRDGGERYFGLTNQTLPSSLLDREERIDPFEAVQALIEKFIRAYGIVDPRDARFGWLKLSASERQNEVDKRVSKGALIPLEIEGVKRTYYLPAQDLPRLEALQKFSPPPSSAAPLTFLPPLDNFLWSRERIVSLFNFDYKWEIYTPATKRKYGPYAMPILLGERLIGRLDPLLDRKNGVLIARLIQVETGVRVTQALKRRLTSELKAFARFHNMKKIIVEKTVPEDLDLHF